MCLRGRPGTGVHLPHGNHTPGTAVPPAGETAFSARDLGLGDPITLRGDDDDVQLAIPVPPGTTPTELTMAVDLPADLARGTIDVESGQRFIAHADLPPGPATRVPITLPLNEATVEEQAATVTLHVNLFPDEGRCPDDWFDHGAVLRDIRTGYTGSPDPPTVIADFLPPILQELRVYVPDTPSDLESTAALSLSTAIVAHYGSQPIRVSLRRLAPDGSITEPDDPFTRSVAIRAGGDAATTLTPGAGIPSLLITGNDAALLDQTRLLTSRVADFAVASRAVVGSLDQAPVLAPDTTTLGELGAGTLTASSHAEVSVRFSLDQSQLGRPAGHIRMKLQGHYTPLPPSQAGQLVVTAGEQELANWAADSAGQIDRWIDIPDDVLQRNTPVQVTLRTTGDTGRCGTDQPLTLTILPGSEVTGDAAPGGPPRGFQALPQGLLPVVEVGATGGGFDDLSRAVAVTAALPRPPVRLAAELLRRHASTAGRREQRRPRRTRPHHRLARRTAGIRSPAMSCSPPPAGSPSITAFRRPHRTPDPSQLSRRPCAPCSSSPRYCSPSASSWHCGSPRAAAGRTDADRRCAAASQHRGRAVRCAGRYCSSSPRWRSGAHSPISGGVRVKAPPSVICSSCPCWRWRSCSGSGGTANRSCRSMIGKPMSSWA